MFQSEGSTPHEKGQRPDTMSPPSTLRARPAGSAIPEGDQRIGVRVPYLALRAARRARASSGGCQVADVPGHGRAAARELGRNVDERHEVELHAAEGLRLGEAEEARPCRSASVSRESLARCLAARALAQGGHERMRPRERLVVADSERNRRPGLPCCLKRNSSVGLSWVDGAKGGGRNSSPLWGGG